jgi:hypothetical protein
MFLSSNIVIGRFSTGLRLISKVHRFFKLPIHSGMILIKFLSMKNSLILKHY